MIEEIHGTTGSKDERGLISVVVPYRANNFAEIFEYVQPPTGLKEVARTFMAGPGATFRVEVTFEGRKLVNSDGSATYAKPEEITYTCSSSFREEPIEAHPKIQDLIKKFNGQTDLSTGKVTFPATLEATSGENALANEEGGSKETRNPMAGVEKYMALEIVWEKKYISTKMPSVFGVGRVIANPPGNPPQIPKRDAWLVMPAQFTKRGTVYEITEQWQLLPEGTPKEVYNLGATSDGSSGFDASQGSDQGSSPDR